MLSAGKDVAAVPKPREIKHSRLWRFGRFWANQQAGKNCLFLSLSTQLIAQEEIGLPQLESADASLPRIDIRRAASFAILLHFLAIATAVISVRSGRFDAPWLTVGLSVPFRPYLRFLFLESPYRFFAPNPGPTLKFYLRIERRHEDPCWVEFPRRSDMSGPIPYHRALELVERNLQGISPSNQMTMTEQGRICLSSFVRHVARISGGNESDATPASVSQIEAYAVEHSFLSPDQIRSGMKTTDLRLYRCYALGRFNSDGRRTDEGPVRELAMEVLATQMLVNDVLPRLKQRKSDVKATETIFLMKGIGVPDPICALVAKSPELLEASPGQLATRLHAVVGEANTVPGT